ncbi:phosphoenolpyruvate--protein phosphotransferase [Sansalvadorimonas verongulae]|uniref:phosphoenolpyruvate--protein phosphotransferase n=1 Tax=Sansalvadorimonas verongulae TaxID=2172824 RepID=UPI0012BC1104|nr:phosphoenolpyruvate--protein phosphotransferase [Sansalvadorimonas verongulae]MTI13148.1 phosphoenolpyruvate--protein phosphotransferase [Sansalvadorimonas verongulae]
MILSKGMIEVLAPLTGELLPLTDSVDPVFAGGMVGEGIIINPGKESVFQTVHAPFAGVVTQMHASRHAVTVKHDSGVEVLIHVGVDTVMLKGEGFETFVVEGDKVEAGQPLLNFDAPLVASKAISVQTAVMVTTGESVAVGQTGIPVDAGKHTVFATGEGAEQAVSAAAQGDIQTLTFDVTVLNPVGLHARPASQLVQIIRGLQSEVQLVCNGKTSIGTSLTAIMGLATERGSVITVTVAGVDAQAAKQAIEEGFRSGLGEDVSNVAASVADDAEEDIDENEPPLLASAVVSENILPGVKAASGLVIGNVFHQSRELPSYPEMGIDIQDELGQLDYGVEQARKGLTALVKRLKSEEMDEQAEVFTAHLEMLDDPAIGDHARQLIEAGKSAMWAWHTSFVSEATQLSKLDNPMLAARATDVEDVGGRVMRHIMGVESDSQRMPENTILVLEDITPSEVVTLDRSRVVGICTLEGGSTSHAAILAASLNLPYLVNVPEAIRGFASGTTAILDAGKSRIHLQPTGQDIADCQAKAEEEARVAELARQATMEPAVTKDGHHMEVVANIGSQADAEKAVTLGAEGVGLLRSEFLYLERTTEPSIAEQTAVYEGIFKAMGKDRPVIVRTLDVGGDKPLAYLPLPKEENPFLGERGVRIGISRPAILRKQVRAILRAAHAGNVRIMFPMIGSLEEFQAVKKLVREEEAKIEGLEKVEIGVMIEVPSAALMADILAEEVDFFSIGTNDLTQYTLAVDRGHPKLAARADALHPSVLRLIDMTVKAGQKAGKWTGVCGSLGSDPAAAAILVGLGVKELSVSVPSLPLVKAAVRDMDFAECQTLAQKALSMSNAQDVRALI